ncbi:hypothetical protein BDN72DRAFT_898459 [Pluteus cervinus]|uniref:Uncharacterized protein n=1 Tax=Pluteus cervinus TaxID=181527 RepID=A0ACD3AQM4_9AGAR|nr:hypothetical protein BDN72DRAFT_898459 [Pluteus cervinus]
MSLTGRETKVSEKTPGLHVLPVELLGGIFVVASKPLEVAPQNKEIPCLDLTALTIGHVCQAWRALIRSLPEIWASITIYHPTARTVEAVKFYLELSGPYYPLSIVLNQYIQDPISYLSRMAVEALVEEQKYVVDIIDLWTRHAARWRSIKFNIFDGPTATIPQLLVNIDPCHMQLLESVDLKFDWPDESTQKFWHVIQSSPVLRSVVWDQKFPPRIPGSPKSTSVARLYQLTSLSLVKPITIDDVIQCLSWTPNIRQLLINILLAPAVATTVYEITTLHHLNSLCIGVCESVDPLFDRLKTPSLSHVRCYEMEPTAPPALTRLISRSSCRLEDLKLKFSGVTANGLLEMITTLSPALTCLSTLALELSSPDVYITETLVQQLMPKFDPHNKPVANSISFPALKRLMLGNCSVSPDCIAWLVVCRQLAGVLLRSLVVKIENSQQTKRFHTTVKEYLGRENVKRLLGGEQKTVITIC